MSSYNVNAVSASVNAVSATVLKIGFGTPAQNDVIVRDAAAALEACKLEGGELVLLNGPASLPVSCVLSHRLAHLFGAIACFDPKIASYVVVITHDPRFGLGQLIPAAEVKES